LQSTGRQPGCVEPAGAADRVDPEPGGRGPRDLAGAHVASAHAHGRRGVPPAEGAGAAAGIAQRRVATPRSVIGGEEIPRGGEVGGIRAGAGRKRHFSGVAPSTPGDSRAIGGLASWSRGTRTPLPSPVPLLPPPVAPLPR